MRKLPLILLVAAGGIALGAPLRAATLLEYRSGGDPAIQKMWVDGNFARIEGGSEPGAYSLFDLRDGRLYGVNPGSKQIVEFDFDALAEPEPDGADAPKAAVALEDLGAGPRIAGHATRRYRLKGDGEACGEYYLSKDALANDELRKVLASLRRISALGAQAGAGADPCEQADAYVIGQYLSLGLPMRQTGIDGKLDHEVVRIDTAARLPAGGTALPKDYRRLSMEDYVKQMMRQPRR